MSDLPQQNTILQYVADGITTNYSVTFFVPEESDGEPNIAVYVTASGATPDPTADLQVWGVDYTYAANIDPITGGTITFEVGHVPANGSIVTLSRDVQAALNVEFSNAQNFSGANLDDALDKLLLICQQNKSYALERNLSYKVNSYLPEVQGATQLDPLPEGWVWMGTASGGVEAVELEQNPDVSTLRSELANESTGTDGAGLVGYYDETLGAPTTVRDFLNGIVSFMQTQLTTQLWQVGDLKDLAHGTIPSGWLACDGSAVSRTTYSDLFAVIGTTWGAGDTLTTFNLPDFRRRTAVGSGGSGTATLGSSVGDTGGQETHTLTTAEMPAHTHAPGGGAGQFIVTGGASAGGTGSLWQGVNATASTGDGGAHNNIQPSAIVTKIIKY